MRRIIKTLVNLLIVIFLLLICSSLITHNIGFFIFSLSFLVLFTVIKSAVTLIDLKLIHRPTTISKNIGRPLALFLLLAGVLIFVSIFFQWWRLFFELGLRPTEYALRGLEYGRFVENLRVLAHWSFVLTLPMCFIVLKRLKKIYLLPPALLVLILSITAFQMGRNYFPTIGFPPPTGELEISPGTSIYSDSVAGGTYYPFSRLSGMTLLMPFISLACVFILQKAYDIFKSPVQIKLSTATTTIGFYLAIIAAEIIGFLALAMVTQLW